MFFLGPFFFSGTSNLPERQLEAPLFLERGKGEKGGDEVQVLRAFGSYSPVLN